MKKNSVSKQSPAFLRIAVFFLGWIFKFLYRYKVVNKEVLPKEGAYILCGNHISNTDPILMAVIFRHRPLHFMAKSELFKNKIFGFIMYKLGAFPVIRGAADEKAINLGQELLRQGAAEVIYLEGTRSKTGEFLRPKTGAAMIAYSTNTPIIPVCITAVGKKWVFSKRVLHCGEPLTPKDLGMIEGTSAEFRSASRKIMEILSEFREEDLKNLKIKK